MNTKKYRIWFAVPVEVSANDEIEAEQIAMNLFDVVYIKPMRTTAWDRLKSMQYPLSNATEIRVGRSWKRLI